MQFVNSYRGLQHIYIWCRFPPSVVWNVELHWRWDLLTKFVLSQVIIGSCCKVLLDFGNNHSINIFDVCYFVVRPTIFFYIDFENPHSVNIFISMQFIFCCLSYYLFFTYLARALYTAGRKIIRHVRFSVGLVLYNFKSRKRGKLKFSVLVLIL